MKPTLEHSLRRAGGRKGYKVFEHGEYVGYVSYKDVSALARRRAGNPET